ncbi:MAG: hypothetical protein LBR79_03245 [Oscillospiraceae bacterium]|nr:hypothetical protein [Oscillospiraceae bacterium]
MWVKLIDNIFPPAERWGKRRSFNYFDTRTSPRRKSKNTTIRPVRKFYRSQSKSTTAYKNTSREILGGGPN